MTSLDKTRVRYIFTYGTLMSTATGDMGAAERALLNAFAKRVGPTTIRGRMYDAGACPGVVLEAGPGEIVQGELWHLPRDLPDLVAALDRYEGCAPLSPLPHPYARRRIRVAGEGARRVTAWVYEWVKATDGLPRIEDGRWRGPLRAPVLDNIAPDVVAA